MIGSMLDKINVELGLFSVSLNTYWGQFEGSLRGLLGYCNYKKGSMKHSQADGADAGIIDYSVNCDLINEMNDVKNITSGWLAYCLACSVSEFGVIFNKAGVTRHYYGDIFSEPYVTDLGNNIVMWGRDGPVHFVTVKYL